MVPMQLKESYDETPYPDLCYTQTHPDRLATLATLLGLSPAPVAQCRVLELGCAGGGNLIPMAYGLPESQFTGIDFSSRQIERGRAVIRELGLTNIVLEARDILEVSPDVGEFDYIIAHGVYSWVPASVRDRLLAICKQCLASNGIATISYNTYPGWHMMGSLREMMLYHTRHLTDPHERVTQARTLINFLAQSVHPDDPYGTFLDAYQRMLQTYDTFVVKEREKEQHGDELLLHDELEAVNEPVYFYQFAEHAARHGLQYLVEADFPRVMPTNFRPDVARALSTMASNSIEMEQYMDFLRNRTFRQTLLCHDTISIQRSLQTDLRPFHIATYAQPLNPERINLHNREAAQFRGPDGAILTTDHPVSKAAMLVLAKISPQSVPFSELLRTGTVTVYGEGTAAHQEDAPQLTTTLLRAMSYSMRLVELHLHVPAFVLDISERPLASSLARLQARQGQLKVTSLRHERVRLDKISQHLLPYLDGTHDQTMLLAALVDLVKAGTITLEKDGEPVTETAVIRDIMAQELAMNLRWLARAALLQG
jgi:methyltransferase-like protein/2-polyprenyl-3-methyl-5-hydroxy-6-metoxy-1,4-benzoquinol methylase